MSIVPEIDGARDDTNLLCCISSDLLKTSVLVRGTIISEIPVSINRLTCNSGVLKVASRSRRA